MKTAAAPFLASRVMNLSNKRRVIPPWEREWRLQDVFSSQNFGLTPTSSDRETYCRVGNASALISRCTHFDNGGESQKPGRLFFFRRWGRATVAVAASQRGERWSLIFCQESAHRGELTAIQITNVRREAESQIKVLEDGVTLWLAKTRL